MLDDDAPRRPDPGYVVAGVLAVIIVVVGVSLAGIALVRSIGSPQETSRAVTAVDRNLPLYWVVRRGQTYSQIAEETGLSVDQLRTFNPSVEPELIVPGQRLKLRLHVPPPPPKRLGPRFWRVRRGQSFGSIAAKTGRTVSRLRQLNPKLKPETLQPGDRVRLRP